MTSRLSLSSSISRGRARHGLEEFGFQGGAKLKVGVLEWLLRRLHLRQAGGASGSIDLLRAVRRGVGSGLERPEFRESLKVLRVDSLLAIRQDLSPAFRTFVHAAQAGPQGALASGNSAPSPRGSASPAASRSESTGGARRQSGQRPLRPRMPVPGDVREPRRSVASEPAPSPARGWVSPLMV